MIRAAASGRAIVAAAVATCALIFVPGASAATIEVNRTADLHDSNSSDSRCDANPTKPGRQCTLRAAIEQANGQGGKDRILLPAKTFPIKPDPGFGSLQVSSRMVVDGKRAAITVIRLAAPASRIFTVDPGSRLELRDATVRDGVLAEPGGAILSNGTLVLRRVRMRDNEAVQAGGGAIFASGPVTIIDSQIGGPQPTHGNRGAYGGGIWITSAPGARLGIRGSTVLGNSATASIPATGDPIGGGIGALGVPVTISRTKIQDNGAESQLPFPTHPEGGGLHVTQGELRLDRVLVARNRLAGDSGEGVGARVLGAPARITRTTFRANKAAGPAAGGGISYAFAPGDRLVLKDSTVSGNVADFAGGVFVRETKARLENVTLSRNRSGLNGGDLHAIGAAVTAKHVTLKAVLSGAIIAGQSAQVGLRGSLIDGVGGLTCSVDGTSSITSLGFNVEDSDACNFSAGSDRPNAATKLGKLRRNGGPTQTHALRKGSAGINRLGKAACPPPRRDQRGVKRPQRGKRCDAGAYERK